MFSRPAIGWLIRSVLMLALLLSLAEATGGAQSLSGTISGLVADDQGGALPGADVILTDQSSRAVQRTTTNAEGVFVFAAVPAGTYTIKVELQNFNSWEATDIELRLGERRSVTGIRLKVGTLSETVSVIARPEIAPLDSGEKSARLTSEQIQNVPMVGRSTAELLKLLPGMTPTSNGTSNSPGFNGEIIGINGNGDGGKQSAVGNFSGNGTRVDALDIVIDGAHASDPGCNCATSVNPNPDMIGEFKVLQSNYAAEHAKGPITIDAISKTGGREFRGTAYLYLRDYRMNSNEWLLNRFSTAPGAENKPKNQFAYPGFNIGGPLIIPGTDFNKNRDRVFFFTGYEFYRQKLDTGTLQSWVPTAAMRQGDFSDSSAITRLGNGYVNTIPTNLVNGRVPANLINADGRRLLDLFPLPNADPSVTDGYNYVQNVPLDQNMQQWLTRVDVNISNDTRLFARYNLQAEEQNFPVGLWWRNPVAGAVSHGSHRPEPVAFDDREPDQGLRHLDHQRVHLRCDLHRFPEPVPRSESRLPIGARLYQPRHLPQRPRSDSVDDRLGQRADALQPGRVRSGALRDEVADIRGAERDESGRRAHDEGRRLLRVGEQQPARQRRLERPAGARQMPRSVRAATISPTS